MDGSRRGGRSSGTLGGDHRLRVHPIPDPPAARQVEKDRGRPARLQRGRVNVVPQVGRHQVVGLPVLRLPPAGLHPGDREQDVGVLLGQAADLDCDRDQSPGRAARGRCLARKRRHCQSTAGPAR